MKVGCLKGVEVIVLIKAKEMYTSLLENHKSITIVEAISANGRELLLLLVICLRKRIMESWIYNNLKGGEVIA